MLTKEEKQYLRTQVMAGIPEFSWPVQQSVDTGHLPPLVEGTWEEWGRGAQGKVIPQRLRLWLHSPWGTMTESATNLMCHDSDLKMTWYTIILVNYLSTGSTHTTAKEAVSLNRTEKKLSHLLLTYTPPPKVLLESDSTHLGVCSWNLTNKTRTEGF